MIALIMTALFKSIVMNYCNCSNVACATWNPVKEGKKEGITLRDFMTARESFYFYVFLYIFYHRNWKL